MIDRDSARAALLFEKLSAEHPADPVPVLMAQRVRRGS
jgi:hypothetical protein